jgi:hypothetical protein
MSYQERRYRVVAGRLEKVWDGRNESGWYKTKDEALAAVNAPEAVPEAVSEVIFDWDRPWFTVLGDLKALGFKGGKKSDGIAWALSQGMETPE